MDPDLSPSPDATTAAARFPRQLPAIQETPGGPWKLSGLKARHLPSVHRLSGRALGLPSAEQSHWQGAGVRLP